MTSYHRSGGTERKRALTSGSARDARCQLALRGLKSKRPLLFVAYTGRATATLAAVALGMGAALSGAGPYLKMLMEKAGSETIRPILVMLQ